MVRRMLTGLGLALLAALSIALPASAGGWATVELDEPIGDVAVDESTPVGFTMLQHGQTPVDWPKTAFTATNKDTGETVRFDAKPEGDLGHWVVNVTFPSAGTWDWEITTAELEVEGKFEPLSVVDGAAVAGASDVTTIQLQSEVETLGAEMDKQLSSLSLQLDKVQKEVTNLTVERDMLQKQVADLQAAQSAPASDSGSGISSWLAAIVGAVAATLVIGAGYVVALRRGLIDRVPVAARA